MAVTDHSDQVALTAKDFLSQLGLSEGISVQCQYDSDADLYQVLFQTSKPALLIGYHGETLSSFQLMLGQHLRALLGNWVNLSVNVNDYRERRESSLTSLADSAVAQVLSTGQPHALPPMSSNERRIVHLYLSSNPQVTTASEGTGRSRCVIISPRA